MFHPTKTKQIEKEGLKEKVKRKGALVRNVVIRDGYFTFVYLTAPGEVSMLTAENVTLHTRDIFLGRDLCVFFRSLLEPLDHFQHRP
jgi:hypothetical protein